MNPVFQLLLFAGLGMIVYAVFGIFFSANSSEKRKTRRKIIAADKEPSFEEERIQGLNVKIASLKNELDKANADYANLEKEFKTAKARESKLQEEVARNKEWVARSEETLNKVKAENADLNNKFIAREQELQGEFSKNVNLNRDIRELKEKQLTLEKENKDRADQLEAQKHKIEMYAKELKAHLETIAEFKKKEELSEWIPKVEFSNLNEKYSELEKELAAKEEKFKKLAEELMQLKQDMSSNSV